MLIAERSETFATNGYRFAFNGQEGDDEVNGKGNSLNFGARIFDSRIGRWMSLDPLMKKFSGFSTYCFAIGNPIYYKDYDGRDIIPSNWFKKSSYSPILDNILANKESLSFYTQILKQYDNTDKDLTLRYNNSAFTNDGINAPAEGIKGKSGNAEVRFSIANMYVQREIDHQVTGLSEAKDITKFTWMVHETMIHGDAGITNHQDVTAKMVFDAVTMIQEYSKVVDGVELSDKDAAVLFLAGLPSKNGGEQFQLLIDATNERYGLSLDKKEIGNSFLKIAYKEEVPTNLTGTNNANGTEEPSTSEILYPEEFDSPNEEKDDSL
jgi:RHS repeat-associated protein